MNTTARRFAIQETNCPDQSGGTLFWNFTAWRADYPEQLLDAAAADAELSRLRKCLPHAAQRLSIVDVARELAKGKAMQDVVRAAAAAMRYDALPKGEAKDAARQVLRAVRVAAGEAFEAGAAA